MVLTGAGISAESGLQTFRGQNGLWEGQPIEEVATPEAFYSNPEKVYRFYNLRRAQLLNEDIAPNPAHIALSLMEKKHPKFVTIITQNVDNLHERAGSKGVIHMHGELNRARCLKTGKTYPWTDDLDGNSPHPEKLENQLRPDIVWFGEQPYHMGKIQSLLERADIFLSIGTSGMVYPAAQFVTWVKPTCSKIEFNIDPTQVSHLFEKSVVGPASKTVPKFLEKWL